MAPDRSTELICRYVSKIEALKPSVASMEILDLSAKRGIIGRFINSVMKTLPHGASRAH